MQTALRLVERGLIPELLMRRGIRGQLRARLSEQQSVYGGDRAAALADWVLRMRRSEVAPTPHKANEQHYEVPPAFFALVLGGRLKYSSGLYEQPTCSLDQAEEAMLTLTAQRAALADGQRVLELGCGWGSLTLWMAERFPRSRIVGVSNSAAQRQHILDAAARRGLRNITVLTCDMNQFESLERFDRIVSVEMFEHMRNWELLLRRVAGWLQPDGRLFLHVFAHRHYAYAFEDRDTSDWMSRYFFSGGMMPCHDLIEALDVPLESEQSWIVSGENYARTAEHWLANLEHNRAQVLAVFRQSYGPDAANLWFQRWRLFFLACAELFAYDTGREWIVSHRRLRLRASKAVLA